MIEYFHSVATNNQLGHSEDRRASLSISDLNENVYLFFNILLIDDFPKSYVK